MNWYKFLFYILIGLVIAGVFYYLGKSTVKTEPIVETKYIKGDTIRDSVLCPQLIIENKPIDTVDIIKECIEKGIYSELFPCKEIIKYKELTNEDTLQIIKDWATKRTYDNVLFDNDSIGKCKINAVIQYNRLSNVSYSYSPVYKEVIKTVYEKKVFSPFIGIGYMVNPWDEVRTPMGEIDLGFFIKEKYGVQARYQRNFKNNNDYVGGAFLIKF